MNDLIEFLTFFLLIILLIIFVFVVIIRWILRINPAIALLEKINKNLEQLNSTWHKCEACGCFAPEGHFDKIDSGQYICNDCRQNMIAVK